MAQSQNSSSLLDADALRELENPRVALVYTEWNDGIVAEQIKGCEKIMSGLGANIIDRLMVPGSFEIPFACKRIWDHYSIMDREQQPEAIIAFGAVIRGGTPHFE